jgi:hypothetical protein
MKRNWLLLGLLLSGYLLFAVSCSTTTLKTVWTDKNYQGGKLNKIFVVGVTKNPTVRRLFEDEFTAQLKAHGADAVAGYTVIPSEAMLDKAAVESKVKILEADAVLVTRLVETKKERVYAEPVRYRSGWYNHYTSTYEVIRYQDNYYEYEVVSLETKLFETKTENLIWSGMSETYVEGTAEEVIKAFIQVIMKSLVDSQLI